MAPRSAKVKKVVDTKASEVESIKKNRKVKTVDEPDIDTVSVEINDENNPVSEKKVKRAKKANKQNEVETNGLVDENKITAKKSKKKKDEIVSKPDNNGETVADEKDDSGSDEIQKNEDDNKANSDVKHKVATGKGRKKTTNKETMGDNSAEAETKIKQKGRSKNKTKQENTESQVLDINEDISANEQPKQPKGRGRKAQQKEVQAEVKLERVDLAELAEETKKGRTKVNKAESPENSQTEEDQDKKGLKKQKKKVQIKEDLDDKSEDAREEITSKKKKTSKKDKIQDDVKEKNELESRDVKPVKSKRGYKKEPQTDVEGSQDSTESAAKRRRKLPDGTGDAKDEEPVEPEMVEAKPVKGKRGNKKVEEPTDETEESQGEPANKRRRRPDEKVPSDDTKKKAPLKNKSTTDYDAIDFSSTSRSSQGKDWNFKICSWNVDGIRAWLNKGGLEYIKHEKPDILCLQETKCSQKKFPDEITQLPGYHAYWLNSDKDGYAGVGIYTTKLAINVQYGLQNEELDDEGRIITAEYEHFFLICTYVPNAGRKLVTLPKRLQWDEHFRNYVKELDKKKPVIICGDMNVAHNEIDLTNPKTNRKNAGFTDEERSGMTALLAEGFVDTYRHLHPDTTGAYTFWTYMMNSRSKNVGWRLDYFIVSERLLPSLCDSVIRGSVYGSDHCPIALLMHLTTANKPKE